MRSGKVTPAMKARAVEAVIARRLRKIVRLPRRRSQFTKARRP